MSVLITTPVNQSTIKIIHEFNWLSRHRRICNILNSRRKARSANLVVKATNVFYRITYIIYCTESVCSIVPEEIVKNSRRKHKTEVCSLPEQHIHTKVTKNEKPRLVCRLLFNWIPTINYNHTFHYSEFKLYNLHRGLGSVKVGL